MHSGPMHQNLPRHLRQGSLPGLHVFVRTDEGSDADEGNCYDFASGCSGRSLAD